MYICIQGGNLLTTRLKLDLFVTKYSASPKNILPRNMKLKCKKLNKC